MAQKYVVVERKNPLKPQEPAKFYAMARSNRRVIQTKLSVVYQSVPLILSVS